VDVLLAEDNNGADLLGMRKVTYSEYLDRTRELKVIEVEGSRINLEPVKVTRITPDPKELNDTSTTVWSFPRRGSWATHKGDYRGNWPPQLVRALLLKYTSVGDTVLDPMVGSGTTCIEAKLLGRNCIGVDINYNAVLLTLHRLYWLEKHLETLDDKIEYDGVNIEDARKAKIEIYHGDARNLDLIKD
jgi:hypothetical protein